MNEHEAELLLDLVERLRHLRRSCGGPLYRRALAATRVAIADAVLGEAEGKVDLTETGGATVILFPKRRRLVRRTTRGRK